MADKPLTLQQVANWVFSQVWRRSDYISQPTASDTDAFRVFKLDRDGYINRGFINAAYLATFIHAATSKTPLAAADEFAIADSAAGYILKKVLTSDIQAFMLAAINTWTNKNQFNPVNTTGVGLGVTRNLTAASTDSPVVSIIQNHATDDQLAFRVQQEAPVNIAEFYDGAVLAWAFADGGLAGNVATPLSQLDITTDATAANRGLIIEQHSANTSGALAAFRKSRATRAAPGTTGSADFIGAFLAQVYDSAAYITPAGLAFKVAGAVSAGIAPVDIIFSATNVDDTGLTAIRMTVKSTGLVDIPGTFNVTGASTLAATTFSGDITMGDVKNIVLNTSTGTKIGTATTQKLGFFNATPIVKPSAYTQTYTTASKTVPNATAVNPPAGGAGATAGAYDTAANRNLMITSLTAVIADVDALRKVVTSLIDDLQALGLVA